MPSIPQSLLWISLVVLWLFVLVPMLINKRDTVRRTSDIALATRVVNDGAKSRLIRRSGPAAGHRHDPDWRPVDGFDSAAEDYPEDWEEVRAHPKDYPEDYAGPGDASQREVIREYDETVRLARMGARSRSVMVVAAVRERSFVATDYLDVDVVEENSGALPVGVGVQEGLFDAPGEDPLPTKNAAGIVEATVPDGDGFDDDMVADTPVGPVAPADDFDDFDEVDQADQFGQVAEFGDEDDQQIRATGAAYEYIEDTPDLDAEDEPVVPIAARPSASRQRRLSTSTAAAVSARKYRFRMRVLMAMAAVMVATAVLSFTVTPALWWSCGATAAVTLLYLAYLRRQTRIEARVRQRRQQRTTRVGTPAEASPARRRAEVDFTEFPTRLQRPGAVVLDIDDEDPVFEHLDEVPYSRRHYGRPQAGPRDLPRVSGL
ncbi:MAG: hypothetical protein FGM52_07285 [Mycobacterium sp.]|nr:hypothetical protein [Mycobacterium sp.]